MMRTCWYLAVVVVLTLGSFVRAEVQYKLTDVSSGYAYGINNKGEVVGAAGGKAFIWDKDRGLRILPLPSITAYAINNASQVVGWGNYIYCDGVVTSMDMPSNTLIDSMAINDAGHVAGIGDFTPGQHAFLYKDGIGMDLGRPTAAARDINNNDQVVGITWYWIGSSAHHQGFLYQGGVRTDLPLPNGYLDASPQAINDAGQIVLSAGSYLSSYTYIYQQDGLTDFIQPAGTYGLDINATGVVVGRTDYRGDLVSNAFIYHNGVLQRLNDLIDPELGWRLVDARAINDSGQIVGCGYNSQGAIRAYLLTPVPEPASLSLLMLGGLAIIRSRRV